MFSISNTGREPDYRFTLANERTFLAWIRTALALLAGGIVLVQISHLAPSPRFAQLIGAGLAVCSALIAVASYRQWAMNQQAMRHDQALPYPLLVPVLCCVFALIGLLTAMWLVLSR